MEDVRDLLYLDFDKAASIWSQFEGGLRERVSTTEDDGSGQKAGLKFGIPKIAEANIGADYSQKRSTLETKILHHDVLNRVDNELSSRGLVVNVSDAVNKMESSSEKVRETIGNLPYIKATGQCVIEDYPRILAICEKFNEIINFIGKCSHNSIVNTPEYQELKMKLEEAQEKMAGIKDRNAKAKEKAKLNHFKEELEKLSPEQANEVEKWLLDGIKLWINTFMPTRINFRTYPLLECPSFQVLCNLKKDCFVDQDPQHLLYGYGTRPNVPLTVFGLITSIPSKSGNVFDPMSEFQNPSELDDKLSFEHAFRNMFGALDELEDYVRYSRYPNITVHPIAVYRSFSPKK